MTAMSTQLQLPDEAATLKLGQQLSTVVPAGFVIYLYGNLGAGKTTLVRGYLRGLGYDGNVKSPTYTLVEPYEFGERQVFHFDLYRLADPEELEYAGGRDYFNSASVCLVEWPERGEGWLAGADLQVYLEYAGAARKVRLQACSGAGQQVLEAIRALAG